MPHRLKALFLALILAFCPLLSTSVSSAEERPAEVSRISQNLLDHLEKDKPGTVMAQVWIGDIDYDRVKEETFKRTNFDIDLLNKDFDAYKDEEIQHYIETKREVARELYEKNNVPFAEKYLKEFKIGYVCQYTPVILIYADWENVKLLESNEQVLWVDYYSDKTISELEVSLNTTQGSYVKSLGYTGQGVKIGILDARYPDVPTMNMTFMSAPADVVYDDHATRVARIIAGPDENYGPFFPSGFCSNASIYCAASEIEGFFAGTEWLISKGVNLITCSVSYDSSVDNVYDSYSLWFDHISFNHDVHFIKSSGNKGKEQKIYPMALSYNVITVGGVDTKKTISVLDDQIFADSSYNSTNSNAMKPDLCAPAVSISTLHLSSASGTSVAAPMVAGVVGQLCQKTPALKTQQGAMKAILTAGVNPSSSIRFVPQNAGYRVSGAGFLDANTAYSIINRGRYVNSTIEKTASYKTYSFTVTSTSSPVRVSLAFQRTVRFSSGSHLLTPQVTNPLSDLDLFVYAPNGAMVGYSNTSRNNVEIVEFNPATYGTGTYRIEVSNYWSDATTYFGLAWS